MFLELNTFLDFDNKTLSKQFVVISSDDIVDHNFVLNHLLMLYLKTGRRVFQLNLTLDDAFFASVCQKLGINLKTFLTSDGPSDRLSLLRSRIIEELDRFLGSSEASGEVLLMVDDVSCLLHLGLSNSEIVKFVHSLRAHEPLRDCGSLVMGSKFNEPEQDAECHQLCTYLSHLADATVDVRGLSTGHSRDITGQISVTRKADGQRPTTKRMHYRLEDKGVKLFPVGLHRLPFQI
ncbi:conserved hypothetical protein [Ixodes scapularis]|uniref:Elongator complex protein 6 n=1 Tax=Ixodes scapularis TaxID=6945 RepID=B7PZS1_IXOSC|nr:conserved hypothetical protein [Ixodes scapularis]|eukprot:XP_002405938.1 conserved hypothetical protein [Ixodes scapularis]